MKKVLKKIGIILIIAAIILGLFALGAFAIQLFEELTLKNERINKIIMFKTTIFRFFILLLNKIF